MIKEFIQDLVDLIFEWGYFGIFLMMAIESSFIPFPSEIVLIPAGYLASLGKMNLFMILFSSILGSLLGAFVNYYLALTLGRKILSKYGKYFFIKEETLEKVDLYFEKHGHISTFVGRLIPGIRQLISIPAGIARMNFLKFIIFTSLGAGVWSMILIGLGYVVGENQEMINIYLREIIVIILISLSVVVLAYIKLKK